MSVGSGRHVPGAVLQNAFRGSEHEFQFVVFQSYTEGQLPSVEELRDLVAKINAEKTLGFMSSSIRSRELPLEEVASVEHRTKGLTGRGLHVTLANGEKLFFRFLQPDAVGAAQKSLASVLKDRFSVK